MWVRPAGPKKKIGRPPRPHYLGSSRIEKGMEQKYFFFFFCSPFFSCQWKEKRREEALPLPLPLPLLLSSLLSPCHSAHVLIRLHQQKSESCSVPWGRQDVTTRFLIWRRQEGKKKRKFHLGGKMHLFRCKKKKRTECKCGLLRVYFFFWHHVFNSDMNSSAGPGKKSP